MKNPIFLSVFLTLFFSFQMMAQDKMSWRQHVKLAETLYGQGQFADAAEHYRAAWKKKTKKKEYIYKAGECFFLVRDYRNAADSWQHVKNDFEIFFMTDKSQDGDPWVGPDNTMNTVKQEPFAGLPTVRLM